MLKQYSTGTKNTLFVFYISIYWILLHLHLTLNIIFKFISQVEKKYNTKFLFLSLMTPVSDTTQKNRVAVYNILKYMYTLQFYTYQYNNLHRWLSYVWKSVTNIFGKIYREFPHGKQIRWQFNVDSCTLMTAWRQPFACNSKFFCVLQTSTNTVERF